MRFFSVLCFIFMTVFSVYGQIPSITIKDLDGKDFSTASIDNGGKPIIINFWATWCSPCKRELNTIAEVYEDWVDETGVKLIAISIDDTRQAKRVKPFVNSSDWDYEVYLDANQDFKRAMNVNNPPHTFLLDKDKKVVWQHNSYSPGDEEELYEEILKLIQ